MNLSVIVCAHDEYENLLLWEKVIENCRDERIGFIIKDSGFCKKTKDYFERHTLKKLRFISQSDKGLYDALNFAISFSSDYYLVAGADDYVNIENISFILDRASSDDEVLLGFVECDCQQVRCYRRRVLPYSIKNVVSSHSVGTIIKSDLHKRYGLYDETYKILADMKFLMPILKDEKVNKRYYPVVMGRFSPGGISSIISKERIFEAYRACIEIDHYARFQWIFKLMRIVKFLLVRKV